MSRSKKKCINHVAKRGTALRKLATQTKNAGMTLGGRDQGKLTANATTQLTGYYGKAIRCHPNDLDVMQGTVFVTFNYVSSTRSRTMESVQQELAEGASTSEPWLKGNSQVTMAAMQVHRCHQKLVIMWKTYNYSQLNMPAMWGPCQQCEDHASNVRTMPAMWGPCQQCEVHASNVRTMPAMWGPCQQCEDHASNVRTMPAMWGPCQQCEYSAVTRSCCSRGGRVPASTAIAAAAAWGTPHIIATSLCMPGCGRSAPRQILCSMLLGNA